MKEYPYLPNFPDKVKKAMLDEIGVKSIDELYSDIPENIILRRDLNLPKSISESEVYREAARLLRKNTALDYSKIFVGAGVWPHLIPSIIPALLSRGEFLTAYTP